MKLKGSAWPLGLALVWNWSLQSMILVWYWSMILIWYWSGIDLVLVWYWSGIDPGIGLILILILIWYWLDIEKWINPQDWKKNSFYDWKKSSSILLIRIDQDWFFSIPDPQGIWEDVKMRRCEDKQMWRCEDVWQTPTIRRTLRSDALGKKRNHNILKGHFLNDTDTKSNIIMCR